MGAVDQRKHLFLPCTRYFSVMSPTVLLFEFEGVLADTVPLRRAALRHSLAEDGLTLTDEEWDAHCHGYTVADAVQRVLDSRGNPLDSTAAELVALRADRLFAERAARGLALHAGAYSLISAIEGRARLGIVTRAARREVDFVLKLAGLEHLFQSIVTMEDVREAKPSPAAYELCLERLTRRAPVVRDATLAFEDSVPGIKAAVAAHLRCVAVGPLPAWQRLGAHAALDGLMGVTAATLDRLAAEPTETPG